VILATSNSYKVASIPLKGLRPDGRLILIANPVEPFNIPSPSEFIANRLQIMASVQSGGEYLYEECQIAQNLLKDEFGVTTKNMLYNKEANLLYCIVDAPNKDAISKHHQKFGLKCDWITEVKTTA
jgi:hypothetical protein